MKRGSIYLLLHITSSHNEASSHLLSYLSQIATLFKLNPRLFIVQVEDSQLCHQILDLNGKYNESSFGYRIMQYDIFEDLQQVLQHVVLKNIPAGVSSEEIMEHLNSNLEGVLGVQLLAKTYQSNISAMCRTQSFVVSIVSFRAAQRLLKEGRYRFDQGLSFEVQQFAKPSKQQGPRFARSQDRHGNVSQESSHGKQFIPGLPSFSKKEKQPKPNHQNDSNLTPASHGRLDLCKYHRIDINAKVHLAKPSSAKYFQSRSNIAAYASQGLCYKIISKAPGSPLPLSSHINPELSPVQVKSIQSGPL
jgi:hypothetical protein